MFDRLLAVVCLLTIGLDCGIAGKTYRLKINKVQFDSCPFMAPGAEIIDTKGSSIGGGQNNGPRAELSDFSLLGADGKSTTITVPGCFRVRGNAKFATTIENPYVEMNINVVGMQVCNSYKANSYCAESKNPTLRQNSGGKTCRFCNICVEGEKLLGSKNAARVEAVLRQNNLGDICDKRQIVAGRSYPIDIKNLCTPSVEEFEHALDRKLGKAWRELLPYAKQGSLLVTMHILDRKKPVPKSCLQLGAGLFDFNGPRQVKAAAQQKLKNTCDAQFKGSGTHDEYLACYYGSIDYTFE
uniref:Uncharacterized protein n=1 Tax=Plectus sambesii TaxID=2011161 RepID=A0A914X9I9_9BILA